MSILTKITKGPQSVPVRGVIYGVEGIGKSSLAELFPKPLLADIEDGSHQLNIERVAINSWKALLDALTELGTVQHPYKTLVLDTADWAERYCIEHLLRPKGLKSIEDFGYGKGYTMLAEEFARALTLCDILISKGIHVVWIAHSKVTRVSPPDMIDGFDRYEMKLTKQVAPLLREWSDTLLFTNYELNIVKGNDQKLKGQSSGKRHIYTTRTAAFDAKNRYGLPEILPMEKGVLAPELAAIFSGDRKPVAPPPSMSAPPKPATGEQVEKLDLYAKNSVGRPIIDKALEYYGQITVADFTEEQAAKVITRCQEEMNRASAPSTASVPSDAVVAAAFGGILPWLEANEAKINEYLVGVKWLSAGQTFRDLTVERIAKINAAPERVAKAAGIPPFAP